MRKQLIHQEIKTDLKKSEGIIILDKLRTPENIGMIIRLGVAFAMSKIIIIEDKHSPGEKRIARISRSGIHKIETIYNSDIREIVGSLKNKNYKIIGIEITNDSQSISNYNFQKGEKFVLIFGNERNGISAETLNFCDICLHIPVSDTMSSLNVAMAAAIAIHSFTK